MKASLALDELKSFASESGLLLDRLSPSAAVKLMTEFYQCIRADNCALEAAGDMLLFQWGTYDWGNGPFFTYNLTRQFMFPETFQEDGERGRMIAFGNWHLRSSSNLCQISPILYLATDGVYGQNSLVTLWIISANAMLALPSTAGTLSVDNATQIGASDYNHFYHAVRTAHISAPTGMTLAQWRTASGKDAHSIELIAATLTQAEIFTNPYQTPRTFTLSKPYLDLNGNAVVGTLTLQPFTSKILRPDLTPIPRLTISGSAATTARSGEQITTTFSVSNSGLVTATNVLITNTLPAGASYISGGTRLGNIVSWTVGSLAPAASVSVSHVVTASTTLINGDYRASATGGYSASGGPLVTLIDPRRVYLPLLRR